MILTIVSEDEPTTEIIDLIAKDIGYRTVIVNNYKFARSVLRTFKTDVVIIDIGYNKALAIEALDIVERNNRNTYVIVTSAWNKTESLLVGHKYDLFLSKPFGVSDIEKVLIHNFFIDAMKIPGILESVKTHNRH